MAVAAARSDSRSPPSSVQASYRTSTRTSGVIRLTVPITFYP